MRLILIKHFQVVLESLAVKPPWELQRQIWSRQPCLFKIAFSNGSPERAGLIVQDL